ncbi:uncharacterized protein B0I36DRAFT_412779 [Microdochium trichocladiopsis]|uniref:Secreted protein n=1 Tax=Microdochium trichocladiopsis TaxID=1682393 RepID=A0A9P8Y192_9PEZI|nr:uncharacterized protein B0I36DRAFT_412779 [Microdochium trichocladiopsis]KAH7027332.1 hypothetical protein B0I36DRAFT_412779 [Microdochium trichocladiopsis]
MFAARHGLPGTLFLSGSLFVLRTPGQALQLPPVTYAQARGGWPHTRYQHSAVATVQPSELAPMMRIACQGQTTRGHRFSKHSFGRCLQRHLWDTTVSSSSTSSSSAPRSAVNLHAPPPVSHEPWGFVFCLISAPSRPNIRGAPKSVSSGSASSMPIELSPTAAAIAHSAGPAAPPRHAHHNASGGQIQSPHPAAQGR